MGKLGVIAFVIAATLVAANSRAQTMQTEAMEQATVEATPTADGGTATLEAEERVVTLDPPVDASVTPTVVLSNTVEGNSAESTLNPTAEPTQTSTPTPQQAAFLTCPDPNSITWTRRLTVTSTMNRWQVWQQMVSQRVMSWDSFVYTVLDVNPSLRADGFMFKVGKEYLLPTCVMLKEG